MYEAEPTTTHASMASPWLSGSAFVSSLNAVHDRGYVIIENVMSPEDCRQYRDELEHHMAQSPRGRNVFEGTSSHRLYALLAKSERFAAMVEHPLALAFAEHFLGQSCLLSACLSINLHPGESVQPWHTDDAQIVALRLGQLGNLIGGILRIVAADVEEIADVVRFEDLDQTFVFDLVGF